MTLLGLCIFGKSDSDKFLERLALNTSRGLRWEDGMGAGGRSLRLTCQAPGQPDGAGVGAGRGVRPQQVAEERVREEVEHISWDVPQQHGTGTAVEARHALCLQDGADTVEGAAVQLATGHAHGAQWDVGASGHVASKVQVLCGREGRTNKK